MTEQTATANNPNDIRWNILQAKARDMRVAKAFFLFRSNGIEPVLIKGWAAARFYPPEIFRESIDIDLAVSSTDFENAQHVCSSPEAGGLAIDLHRELRHLDTVIWPNLFENSELVESEAGSVRVLRPEDHLRVLCVHWLTDGGSHKERLWDVYFVIKNRPADFDWSRFLDPVDERRRRWLVCTVGLAHRYLSLDLSGTPMEAEARDLPNWLTTAVEREWASDSRAWPLESSMNEPGMLAKQIRRRLRLNPIWSTVHMNGSFDAKTRIFYQLGSGIKRMLPSVRRIVRTIRTVRTK